MVGLILGLIGSGGSILSVPILVYLFGINPITATAYSLFIVGTTSLIGSIKNLSMYLQSSDLALVMIFLQGLWSSVLYHCIKHGQNSLVPSYPYHCARTLQRTRLGGTNGYQCRTLMKKSNTTDRNTETHFYVNHHQLHTSCTIFQCNF